MKSKRIIPVFFILILSLFPTLPFVESAGYGEENENLGQFTDDYENADNVSVAVNVINNQTLDCMELNFTSGIREYENFTTYTEVDEDGDLTITSTRIDVSTMRRDAETYVWKDFNPNYFGDFEHLFKVNITDLEAGDVTEAAITAFSAMTNSTPDVIDDLQASNWLGVMLHQKTNQDDKFGLRVWQRDGGATSYISATGLTYDINDPVYVTFNRTGTSIGLFIFDSEARTNLIESHTGVGNGKTYRYFMPLSNWGRDVDGADWYSGYIEDLSLGTTSGYENEGYFTTEDYLNYTTGQGLALLTNASIPYDTSMTVQFSNDNATWFDNEGNVGSTPILDGFYAIDLRDLNYTDSFKMYNLSTTNSMITPRLFQSRLVTTIGNVTIIEQNVTGAWIEHNATAISVITGILDDGFLNSTYFIDADSYEVSEVVGAPGWDIRWNFTNIPVTATCGWMNVFYSYDGNLAHVIEVQLYNWTSSSWDTIGLMIDTGGFVWSNSSMSQYPQNYVNEGLVRARAYHTSPGNINHDIKIEYIKLRVFIPFEDEVISADADFFWVFIAIVLSIIVGLLMWLKYEHNNN